MSDSSQSCVIVGASHAGTSLAMQLRREGWQGSIVLISEEGELPYHRPPLSKELLAGSKDLDAIRLRPEKLFADNDITLMLNTRVSALDSAARTLQLAGGETLSYDRLALCTGAREQMLEMFAHKQNVFAIRNVEQTLALKAALPAAGRVVIIGAGYIGLEAAAALTNMGLSVTVIEREARVLQRVAGEELSAYIEALHRSKGVDLRCGRTVTTVAGESSVDAVHLDNGEVLEADVVIVGIGVVPNTELAEQGGLTVADGIVVDKHCRSSDPAIFAAGDCTRHPSALYGRPLRLESVQNANDQARVAAANIAGKQQGYDAVPWFWSDQYDIKLQMAGLNADYDATVLRGDMSVEGEGGFALFYLRGGVLIAADCVARPKEYMVARQLIGLKVKIPAAVLADESVAMMDIKAEYGA